MKKILKNEKTIKSDSVSKIGISIDEAKKRLGIGRNLMLKLTKTKDFPCVKIGKRIIVNEAKLETWFDNQMGKHIL